MAPPAGHEVAQYESTCIDTALAKARRVLCHTGLVDIAAEIESKARGRARG